MPQVLLILESAFSMWMLMDVFRRGGPPFWYFIILLPFGELVYFFRVKVRDPEFDGVRELWTTLTTKKVTLEDLRYRYGQTPSEANRLSLAQALHDAGEHAEALGYFQEILGDAEASSDGLYGLACCQLELSQVDAGIASLQRLVEREPAYHDYLPWQDLAGALADSGRAMEALDLLKDLVSRSPRLRHRALYAHYLHHSGRSEDAVEQLRTGLLENKHAPRFLRHQQRAWVGKAKTMLNVIERSLA